MIENVQVQDKILVHVFMDNISLRVVNNKILVVSEGGSSFIDKTKLKVSHVDSVPSDIKYNVVSPLMYGDLHLKREDDIDDPDIIQRATSFTQSDINNDRLTYVQKLPGKIVDQFTFDVTNGKQVLQGIEFVIEIIPGTIPIIINNFTVEEGGKKTLHSDLIRITDDHFAEDHIIFSIIKTPLHGWIEHKDTPGSYLTRFTSDQLKNERISYVHDHNETLSDQFTILAMSRSQRKQSNPHTIYVHIYPVNDEPPEVVINTLLKVWLRSVTTITRDNLLTVDKDTKPEELWYMISPPTPGHIALSSKPEKEISNFTQAMIDAQQVVFVHSGMYFLAERSSWSDWGSNL
jgi:chondroitin sulfate proteoglycan 4